MAREELSVLAGLWSSCLTSDSEGMVNGEGLWAWLAPCSTSGEGVVVVGDVVKITMETKDGWSHSV